MVRNRNRSSPFPFPLNLVPSPSSPSLVRVGFLRMRRDVIVVMAPQYKISLSHLASTAASVPAVGDASSVLAGVYGEAIPVAKAPGRDLTYSNFPLNFTWRSFDNSTSQPRGFFGSPANTSTKVCRRQSALGTRQT